jgi:hypothetical protein
MFVLVSVFLREGEDKRESSIVTPDFFKACFFVARIFFRGLLFEKGKEGVEAPSFAPYKLNRLKC